MGNNPFYQTPIPTIKFSSEFIRFDMAGYLLLYESVQFHRIKGDFGKVNRKIFGENSTFSGRGFVYST